MQNQTNPAANQEIAAKEAAKVVVEKVAALEEGCAMVTWRVGGCCGEATIPKARIALDGRDLDSELISGSKIRWFPREEIKFVNTIGTRLQRKILSYGTMLNGGVALVPICKLKECYEEVEAIKADFNAKLDESCSDYHSKIERLKLDNANVADLIDRFKLDVDQFRGRFTISVMPPIAFKPLFEGDNDELVESAANNLYQEICKEANFIWSEKLEGNDRVGQAPINSYVKRLFQKMINFSFLDEQLNNVTAVFEELLDNLPKSGWITGAPYEQLCKWILICGDEQKLRNVSKTGYSTLLAPLAQQQAPTPAMGGLAQFAPEPTQPAEQPNPNQATSEPEPQIEVAAAMDQGFGFGLGLGGF